MRKTARLIGTQQWLFNTAHIYELSEPIEWDDARGHSGSTRYVIVSVGFGTLDHQQYEAMAFACDESGEFLPSGDNGPRCVVAVRVGTMDHDDAVRELGFEVVKERVVVALSRWLWRRAVAGWRERRRRQDYCAMYRESLAAALMICRAQTALFVALGQLNEQMSAALTGYRAMLSSITAAAESAAAFSELFKDDEKQQLDEETLN